MSRRKEIDAVKEELTAETNKMKGEGLLVEAAVESFES